MGGCFHEHSFHIIAEDDDNASGGSHYVSANLAADANVCSHQELSWADASTTTKRGGRPPRYPSSLASSSNFCEPMQASVSGPLSQIYTPNNASPPYPAHTPVFSTEYISRGGGGWLRQNPKKKVTPADHVELSDLEGDEQDDQEQPWEENKKHKIALRKKPRGGGGGGRRTNKKRAKRTMD